MKKIFFATFLFLTFTFSTFAKENLFGFSLEPIFGLRNGLLSEYVYENNSKTNKQYYLSLLEWDIKNTFYFGIDTDFRIYKFHLKENFKFFFSNTNGFIEDSDWVQDFYHKTGNTSTKTNFSKHNSTFSKGLNIDLEARYDFEPFSWWTISPTLGFTYEEYELTAKDGQYWYGNDKYYSYADEQNRKTNKLSGTVLNLRRQDYYIWLGFSTKFKTPKHWEFYLDFSCSPYTYIVSRDSHYLTSVNYIDICQANFASFKSKTFVQFNINKIVALKLGMQGLITKEIHGVEYKSENNSKYKKASNVSVGAGSKYFDIFFSGKFTF